MSTSTKNLGLFKYDPSTDKDEKFDISKALNENWDKVDNKFEDLDILVKKSESDIEEIISGNNIHLTDSTDNPVVDFRLYGKSKQFTTTGKNLLKNDSVNNTINGVTFTVNPDGTVIANGTATDGNATLILHRFIENSIVVDDSIFEKSVIVSGCPTGGGVDTYKIQVFNYDASVIGSDFGNGTEPIIFKNSGQQYSNMAIIIYKDTTVSNIVFKPMIRLASIEDDTYEPYTGGLPSPNPDYPQDIEVAGESYNLLENTAKSQTINGVTFTVNEDGSVTANGKSNGNSALVINNVFIGAGNTIILSGCPSGGGDGKYAIGIAEVGTTTRVATDYGSGKKFIADKDYYDIRIIIWDGLTVNNFTFYPMIRKVSVKNDRYMPYGKGSVEVKSVGKNLLPYPYDETTHEESGVTWTDNNGIITTKGTATKMNDFLFVSASTPKMLKKGTYILSGCPKGGELDKTYFLLLGRVVNGQNSRIVSDTGNGATFTLNEDTTIYLVARFIAGTNAEGLTFKPMIRLATNMDDTWQPYKENTSIISTPNGLPAIPVDSGGNYTDENGQQWICDEIVRYADGSGEYVKRINKLLLNGNENWVIHGTSENNERRFALSLTNLNINKPIGASNKTNTICTHFSRKLTNIGEWGGFYIATDWLVIHDRLGVIETLDDFKNYLIECYTNGNPVNIYYEIVPITIPLTAEQLNEINNISTFKPITTITNDFNYNMGIRYIKENLISTQTPIPVIPSSTIDELKSGDTVPTLFGKIKKWLSNIKPHAFNSPVNNLLATVPGNVLDAVQGKVLNDFIRTMIYTDTIASDLNSVTSLLCETNKNTLNTPYTEGVTTVGQLCVLTTNQQENYSTQFAFAVGYHAIYCRTKVNGTWGAWKYGMEMGGVDYSPLPKSVQITSDAGTISAGYAYKVGNQLFVSAQVKITNEVKAWDTSIIKISGATFNTYNIAYQQIVGYFYDSTNGSYDNMWSGQWEARTASLKSTKNLSAGNDYVRVSFVTLCD